jgi:hypothetical protein
MSQDNKTMDTSKRNLLFLIKKMISYIILKFEFNLPSAFHFDQSCAWHMRPFAR